MKDKVVKLLSAAFAMLSILFISNNTYARSVSSIDELGKIIDEKNPNAETAFVIGNYVFTSAHTLTTEDIMLAARSINVEDENGKINTDKIYKEMTINLIQKKYNEETFESEGWEVIDSNVSGETKLFEGNKTADIKYVDYNYVKDIFNVEFELDGGKFSDDKKSIKVIEGEKINEADITGDNRPIQTGKQFKEWVLVKEGDITEKWDFNKGVTGNITLKATWLEEVNTDTLLDQAEKRLKANEWYSAKFDAKNSKLTFTVLDKNEKNSLISGTGITGNIVAILQELNVQSITMGNTKFTAEDLKNSNPAGPDGSVWDKFGKELAALTKKSSFNDVTLGDLVGVDLKLTITVDKEKALSQNGRESEEYTIEFVYNAEATIGKANSEEDVKDLLDTFNYTTENTYQIEGKDGFYTVTGGISESKNVKGFGADPKDGYFFAYTIILDEGVDPATVKVKIPKDNNTTDDVYTAGYNEATFDEGKNTLTVLMEIEDKDKSTNKFRDIIVEVDEVPTKIRIDFSKLELRKASTFEIKNDSVDEKLEANYGWKPEADYSATFNPEGNKVTVTGVIPYLSSWENDHNSPFKDDHETGYYFGFVVKTTESKKDKTTVKIKYGYEGDEEKVISSTSFDDENNLYLLGHLHPEDTTRTFDIIVDLDGDETEYNPYTITVDWSKLLLQKDSETEIKLHNPSDADNTTMTNWNYKAPTELTLSENGILKGKLVEQQLTAEPFGDAHKDGYYFDFKFTSPDGVDKSKIKIAQVETPDTEAKVKKEYKAAEFDDENNLTILFQFEPGTTGCETCKGEPKCDGACCGGSGTCNCDKKLYYRIDWDGDGKEYLPMVYVIDYCGVTFEKSSIVEIADLGTVADTGNANWKGWTEDENYSTDFTTEGNTVKVSGLIPIFDDDSWTESNPFGTYAYDYYLAFKLKKAGTTGTNTNTTVKFLTEGEGSGETNTITGSDFGGNDEIYVLKYINPNKFETTKKFTIKVDFDDDEEEYASYEVTIDWTDLHFQYESQMTEIDAITSEADLTDITSADKEQITKQWGYDFKNAGKDITVEDGSGLTVAYELGGKIKEQALKPEAGFGTDGGYYIVLKINGPTEENVDKNKWTVQLKDSEGHYKPAFTPSSDDYAKGFITALIKLDDGPSSDKKITYMIDWDGDGNEFLPYEETIDYSSLEFLSSHKITIDDGTDAENQIIPVWDEDVITAEMLPEGPKVEEEKDYRSFAYWDEGNGTEFVTKTISEETEDITLVPHWNIYSDKFISDVLEDLNKTEDTQSEDFSKEFVIEDYKENSGEVTITVKDPTVKLSRMNETSIPGTIAYILLKDEIQEITLSINDQVKTFTKGEKTDKDTLKQQVIDDAKGFYSEILKTQFEGKDESSVTLSDLAHKEGYNSFTLKFDPEKVSKTVTLTKAPAEGGLSLASVVDVPNEYKFTFESDAIIVNTEDELNNALKTKAEHIYIGKDFSVKNPVNIGRKVVINGGNEHHKLTASNGAETIFDVKSPDVTIDAIKLDAKTPIVVTSGSLTTTGLTVEGENAETAVEVKNNASLTISELTFDNEKYTKPAVKAEKTNATVKFTDSEEKEATKLETVEKITKYEELKEPRSGYGDTKEPMNDYNYYNYYNNEKHSKIYKTTFHSHEFSSKATFERYNYYNEQVTKPYDQSPFGVFKSYAYDGYTYTLIGFVESRDKTLYFGSYTTEDVPQDVTKVDGIVATSDKLYYGAYNGKVDDDTRRVSDATELYQAIQEQGVSKIYIPNTTDLDLTDKGTITINRPLSIVGPTMGVKIKVKNIKIESTANDVFFHRLKIEANPEENVTSLIDVEGEKFTLWQSSLKNVSDKEVDSAIKYSGNKAIVDIRWNTFDANKIKNTFIDVNSKLAGVTDIYYNTFAKLTTSTDKKSAITIKEFDESAKISEENDETISIDLNTFNDSDYAIKILKEASPGTQADISIESTKDVVIAVQYDEQHKDFSKINIHLKGKTSISNIKLKYINGSEEKETLDDGQGVKVVFETGMQGI